jgi:methyl-accepting chemotaxis protein
LSQRGAHAHLCEESSCYPATGDLLIGRESRLEASSTCGLARPERYCIVSHLEDEDNKCFVCDSRRAYSESNRVSHRVENIVSTFRRDWKHRWWQAENGRQHVSVQLDLEAEFHFTHLIMRFKTFRPAAMLVERSYDFGKTWKVYRYFAYDCRDAWPSVPDVATVPVSRIQDVVCESRYSDVAPSTEGEVIFRVLPPSVEIEDPYSEEVQDLLKMTNLRVNFTKLHTLGDNLLDSRSEIKEKYYYSMYHMVVRGSCSCYGHASHCVPTPEQIGIPNMVYGKCNCSHNTMGLNCERCADFFNDLPWAPARRGQTNACKECQCNGHASRCHFDPAVYEATGRVSGGVCDDCQHNTMGHHCEECKPFFYQDPRRDVTDPNVCQPCDCDPIGSEHGGECESRTDVIHELVAGRCVCKRFVEGRRCDTCIDGYWNMRADNPDGCESCNCFPLGTVGSYGCNKETGECSCKRYVTGRQCDQCMPGYWGMSDDLQGCKPCDCDVGGAYDNNCNQQTGQCRCRPNLTGRCCNEHVPGTFIVPLDWERYEGEFARGIGNTEVVVREVTPSRPATWTGPGFMRVMEGSALEFVVDEIPESGEYDIIIRYEAQMPLRWDDVRMTIVRPSAPDVRGPCANHRPQDDFKAFGLHPGDRAYTVSQATCFEKGVTYTLRLDFQRYRADRFTPEAGILVDSIVLMQSLQSHSFVQSNHTGAQSVLEEMERFRCRELYLNAPTLDVPEHCRKYIFSLSVHTYDGAKDCDCNLIGSYSSDCSPIGGQCSCKPNVIGRQCDRCAPGSFGFGPAGCSLCSCSNAGSLNNNCDQTTGQCSCVANAHGRQCDECQRGYFGFPTCRRCECNGRADECDDLGRCTSCRDFTGGMHCERCADGYYGDPRPGSPFPCRPCMCPGGAGSGYQHGDTCRLDTRTQQVICDCKPGYSGATCDQCADNYYGNPLTPGGTCRRCQCNNNIDVDVAGSCDTTTGECLKCRYFTDGFNCERCRTGYFGDASKQTCQLCDCNFLGTRRVDGKLDVSCDRVTGQCACLPNVVGTKCDQCERNHWKLASGVGCEPCACDPVGALSARCNEYTGQCECREDRGGRDCSGCVDNYWGDPRSECRPCDCDPNGSMSQQCDRRTGKCQCEPGVTGDKCDQCARGTTGQIPECRPCGECFDDWDQVIAQLRNETSILIRIGGDIKYGGAPGAFDREFTMMEMKLNETRRILAGSLVSFDGIDELQDRLRQIRSNLSSSERSLDILDENLQETTNRVELVNNRIEAIKLRVDALKTMAENLRQNATRIKEKDMSGAMQNIRDSYERSLEAQRVVDSTSYVRRQSESVRRDVDTLIRQRHQDFDRNFGTNDVTLRNISVRIDRFSDDIRDLNDVVCDGSGDPCDNLCGGAGCGKCGGGVSCQDGAVTIADNAVGLANRTEMILTTKREQIEIVRDRVSEAQSQCERANSDAQMAHDRAELAKNQSESSRVELQTLIEEITYFLEQHGATPDDIQKLVDEVLAMTISYTPEEINELSRKIEITVRKLTNIQDILEATRADLDRATRLKQRADRAKADALGVLDTANRVVDALDKARRAQDAADQAVGDTDRHISEIENDLDLIETETSSIQDETSDSSGRVRDLRDRIARLKLKFAENEIKIQQATNAANSADSLARRAEQDADKLDGKYSVVSDQLEIKYNETRSARQRADSLRERALDMYQSTKNKVDRLREWIQTFDYKQRDLSEMSSLTVVEIRKMELLIRDIKSAAQYLRTCGTA